MKWIEVKWSEVIVTAFFLETRFVCLVGAFLSSFSNDALKSLFCNYILRVLKRLTLRFPNLSLARFQSVKKYNSRISRPLQTLHLLLQGQSPPCRSRRQLSKVSALAVATCWLRVSLKPSLVRLGNQSCSSASQASSSPAPDPNKPFKPSDRLKPKTVDLVSSWRSTATSIGYCGAYWDWNLKFNTREIQRTAFGTIYSNGGIPCRLVHGSVKNRLMWYV